MKTLSVILAIVLCQVSYTVLSAETTTLDTPGGIYCYDATKNGIVFKDSQTKEKFFVLSCGRNALFDASVNGRQLVAFQDGVFIQRKLPDKPPIKLGWGDSSNPIPLTYTTGGFGDTLSEMRFVSVSPDGEYLCFGATTTDVLTLKTGAPGAKKKLQVVCLFGLNDSYGGNLPGFMVRFPIEVYQEKVGYKPRWPKSSSFIEREYPKKKFINVNAVYAAFSEPKEWIEKYNKFLAVIYANEKGFTGYTIIEPSRVSGKNDKRARIYEIIFESPLKTCHGICWRDGSLVAYDKTGVAHVVKKQEIDSLITGSSFEGSVSGPLAINNSLTVKPEKENAPIKPSVGVYCSESPFAPIMVAGKPGSTAK